MATHCSLFSIFFCSALIHAEPLEHLVRKRSIVDEIFGGLIRSCITNSSGQLCSVPVTDPFMDLSLSLEKNSLSLALEDFFSRSEISYQCQKCQDVHFTQSHIMKSPQVLTIQCKRFCHGSHKISSHFVFDEYLHLKVAKVLRQAVLRNLFN